MQVYKDMKYYDIILQNGHVLIEAAVYEVPLTVGGEQFTMRLGVPPARVGAMMAACGLDGAIGMELLGRKAVLIADGGVWFRQDS